MRRHHIFAAGVSVALLLGAATPAFAAKPAKDPKPPKGPAGQETGGGVTQSRAVFAVDARQAKPAKGHFNYESRDARLKVRCAGFDTYSPVVYIQAGPPAAHLTASCVEIGPHHTRTPISLDATFVDNGRRGKKDEANLTFTRPDGTTVSDTGAIRSGQITVR